MNWLGRSLLALVLTVATLISVIAAPAPRPVLADEGVGDADE